MGAWVEPKPLTVGELIEVLQKLDPTMYVAAENNGMSVTEVEVDHIDLPGPKDKPVAWLIMRDIELRVK